MLTGSNASSCRTSSRSGGPEARAPAGGLQRSGNAGGCRVRHRYRGRDLKEGPTSGRPAQWRSHGQTNGPEDAERESPPRRRWECSHQRVAAIDQRTLGATITTSHPPLSFSRTLVMTQAGSALRAMSSCVFFTIPLSLQLTGTIDSTTGAFTLSGPEPTFCGNTTTFSGTVAADGPTFTAVAECPMGVTTLYPVSVAGSRRGNGVLDPGEVCDGGEPELLLLLFHNLRVVRPKGTSCGFFNGGVLCGTVRRERHLSVRHLRGTLRRLQRLHDEQHLHGGAVRGSRWPTAPAATTSTSAQPAHLHRQLLFWRTRPTAGLVEDRDTSHGSLLPAAALNPSARRFPRDRSTLRVRDDPTDKKDVVSWRLAPDAGISIGDFGDPRSFTSYQLGVFDNVSESSIRHSCSAATSGRRQGPGRADVRQQAVLDPEVYVLQLQGQILDLGTVSGRSTSRRGTGRAPAPSVFAKGPSVGIAELPAGLPVVVQSLSS